MTTFTLYIASCTPEGGIFRYRFSGDASGFTAELQDVSPCPACGWLSISGDEMIAVSRSLSADCPESALSVRSIASDGALGTPGIYQSTLGRSGCHAAKAGDAYYAVNYMTGNIVKLPEGRSVQHTGRGLDPLRQEGPHTHCVLPCPDKKTLAVTDLGLDTVSLYDLDLNLLDELRLPAGTGPRHLCFAPEGDILYCIGELDSVVHLLHYTPGRLSYLKSVPAWDEALPEADGGAIRCDERFVYVANRRHSRIALLERSGDGLRFSREIPCGGDNPRDFAIFENFGFSCNIGSNTVTVFYAADGTLAPLGGFSIPAPYCAAFRAMPEGGKTAEKSAPEKC